MRTREERKAYRQYKYMIKQSGGRLKYSHGVYTLKFDNQEGPTYWFHRFHYTVQDTNLKCLIESYSKIKAKEHY